MKLSEKGYWQVRNVCCEYNYNYLKIAEELGFFDFKQEHFKGAVVLTIDDAKVLNALISDRNLCKSYPETTEYFSKLLDQLIKQVEKYNG